MRGCIFYILWVILIICIIAFDCRNDHRRDLDQSDGTSYQSYHLRPLIQYKTLEDKRDDLNTGKEKGSVDVAEAQVQAPAEPLNMKTTAYIMIAIITTFLRS
jgi:hypothetical protein